MVFEIELCILTLALHLLACLTLSAMSLMISWGWQELSHVTETSHLSWRANLFSCFDVMSRWRTGRICCKTENEYNACEWTIESNTRRSYRNETMAMKGQTTWQLMKWEGNLFQKKRRQGDDDKWRVKCTRNCVLSSSLYFWSMTVERNPFSSLIEWVQSCLTFILLVVEYSTKSKETWRETEWLTCIWSHLSCLSRWLFVHEILVLLSLFLFCLPLEGSLHVLIVLSHSWRIRQLIVE